MMRYPCLCLLVFSLNFWLPPLSAHAGPIVADNLSFVPNAWMDVGLIGAGYENPRQGQAFAPSANGRLSEINAYVVGGWNVATTQPLTVSLHTAVRGLPDELLGSLTFASSQFSTYSELNGAALLESFDMTPLEIDIRRAHRYIVTFHTTPGVHGASSTASPYHIGAYPEIGIRRGPLGINHSWANNGVDWEIYTTAFSWELALRVSVIPQLVPEPTSAATFGLGGVLLMLLNVSGRRSRNGTTESIHVPACREPGVAKSVY
jgi:hypothetical protein